MYIFFKFTKINIFIRAASKNLVIAVDGYSSCGKSTLAKSLAGMLGYLYIDSGAMYRAVTYFCLKNKLVKEGTIDTAKLFPLMKDLGIGFQCDPATGKNSLYLNGENIEEEIRGIEVADNVSHVAKIQEVRGLMVKQQREMGKNKRIVMDGRDIGTVVFPDADLKIFMTADPEIRAFRRYKEFQDDGKEVSIDEVKENIRKRDYIDENREESPLRKAADAIVLDNSKMSREEQLAWVVKIIEENF